MASLFTLDGQVVGSLFLGLDASFVIFISKWMLPGWYTLFENL
jgi:hypothetical protein